MKLFQPRGTPTPEDMEIQSKNKGLNMLDTKPTRNDYRTKGVRREV